MLKNGLIHFNYGQSYLEREHAIPLYLPELPLQAGELPLPDGLTMPGSLRDAAPDAWGRRVILNRKFGVKGNKPDAPDFQNWLFSWSQALIALARSISSFHPENMCHAPRPTRHWKNWLSLRTG